MFGFRNQLSGQNTETGCNGARQEKRNGRVEGLVRESRPFVLVREAKVSRPLEYPYFASEVEKVGGTPTLH